MEEYTQITLDQWMEWKEDIRRKLEETAGNFVYIGYRLKQIRDSGMFGGAADIFEFAKNEYGLGKSTVSRFIAINEKYSEGGNSLELREEFKGFSSSKLAEMLTLPDNEIQLITEKTTVKEIRELKEFGKQEVPQEQEAITEAGYTRLPLEKCLIDFFGGKKEMIQEIMGLLSADPPEYQEAAELMNPSGQTSHKKGLVFLFLYDWNTGVKYKILTEPEPVSLTWPQLLDKIGEIYSDYDFSERVQEEEKLEEKPVAEKNPDIEENQGKMEPVATSQQQEKESLEAVENAPSKAEAEGVENEVPEEKESEEQLQGQMKVEGYPGAVQKENEETESVVAVQEEPEASEAISVAEKSSEDYVTIREEAQELSQGIGEVFWGWEGHNVIPKDELEVALKNAKKLVEQLEKLIKITEDMECTT